MIPEKMEILGWFRLSGYSAAVPKIWVLAAAAAAAGAAESPLPQPNHCLLSLCEGLKSAPGSPGLSELDPGLSFP